MTAKYDAIVIGTGQAGPSLAGRLAGAGMKVAVVERKLFGGTCVNTGCIPTKTLVASARAAYMAKRAADFGVIVNGSIAVDMKKVKERKDAVVRNSNVGVEKWLKGMENAAVYEGHAKFTASHTVEVRDTVLEADKIFINVGARATIPPVEGIGTVPYLTNSGMMDIDVLPEHLVIVGGGYIALEFGQMYRRFGSKVTIVQRSSRLLSKEDADVSTAVQEILENEGVQVCTNTRDLSVRNENGRIAVRLKCNDEAMEVSGSHLLVAAGRTPNTDDLGLEAAAIETDPRGFIQVDDQLRTNVEGVWALGECNGQGAFTHTAYNDFEIVAANLLDGDQRRVSGSVSAS